MCVCVCVCLCVRVSTICYTKKLIYPEKMYTLKYEICLYVHHVNDFHSSIDVTMKNY